MSSSLKYIRIGRYGLLADREVGPFGEGLNVVYGPNEAGKTTIASLVRGVLFGWEEARGVRNRYRPETGGRYGELVWQHTALGDDGTSTTTRAETGVTGDLSVIQDVDQKTYDALFSLDSDELKSLRDAPDVTARLLTAGAGTPSDPASAFVDIERRIANTPVYELSAELDEKREQVKKATERERLHVQEDRELRELKASREVALGHIGELDGELDELMAQRAELASLDKRSERVASEVGRLRDDLAGLVDPQAEGGDFDQRLLALDSAGMRVLSDRLDELAEEQEKVARAVDAAKENSASSTAAYEALCELDEESVAEKRRLRNRPWQASVSVLLPIAFIAAGIPLFLHGRDINSLSITALGVSLVVVAVFLAAAAFIGLFRQPQGTEALEARRKDAQWVMLQDKKRLDSSLAERDQLDAKVRDVLDAAGLGQADGSIRQARLLLEEASALHATKAEELQREKALRLRIAAAEQELAELAEVRNQIAEEVGLADAMRASMQVTGPLTGRKPLAARLDALIREKSQQRDALVDASADMAERVGELAHKLDLARTSRETDELKLEYHQIRARLREAKHELITLLVAQRMLERSIATWEAQGQPEVYARAGSLLSTITAGSWVGVSASQTGSLVAVSADGAERDPRHLSLGTCQQLYLSLRLALLITVADVGRAIPVLADDILVNFDSTRRAGAATALAELARHRQVIVFTCHRETVEALERADCSLTCINLA